MLEKRPGGRKSLRSESMCLSSDRLPTPGVAYITRSLRADAGIVLSASHNPYQDNGTNFSGTTVTRLDDQIEEKIEHLFSRAKLIPSGRLPTKSGARPRIDDALRAVRGIRQSKFSKGNVARGNACRCRCRERRCVPNPRLASCASWALMSPWRITADGMNINDGCGSMHPEEIQRIVQISGADVGIAHDGDADRVLLCDENGEIVDGRRDSGYCSAGFFGSWPVGAKHSRRHRDEQFWPR